jgi:hypothetical protein
VWQILDASEWGLVLANAKEVRNMPERETDTNDCVWLATPLRKGLVKASFGLGSTVQELPP